MSTDSKEKNTVNEVKSKEKNNINNKADSKADNKTKKKSKRRMFIVLLFIVLVAIIGYVIFRGEYLEILEIGKEYVDIFWQNVNYMSITFVINFIFLFIVMYLNNNRIKKALKTFFETEKKEMPRLPNKSLAFIISVIVSAITSEVILNQFMLFTNSTMFNIADPVFGLDVGYFMFQKPFIETILLYAIFLIIGLTIYTVIYYIAVFNICFDGLDRDILKRSNLLKQLFTNLKILAVFLAGFVLMKTQDIGFNKFLNLQEDKTYSIYGAGVTDTTIKLWGYMLLPILIILSVFMAIKEFNQHKTKKVIMWILVVPIYLIVLIIVMALFQVIFINPNELDKEENNIQNNITFTKQAYGIESSQVYTIENGGETITEDTLNTLSDTINNIALVDSETVLQDLNTIQTEKGYYTYDTAKISSYRVNGKQQLVYISPREIANANGTYNNQTYEYTHGYGIVVTSATSTDENGNLLKLQKDFNSGENDVVTVKEPRIYFGLQTNNNVVTNSQNRKEFDYPESSTTNAENVYSGNAGLSLNFIDRFILGIKEGDLKLAFSANVNADSKILTNRNIIERAKTLMPYLLYDENPYMVVDDDGNLIWVLDAYTTSNNYPYSQKTTLQLDALNKLELNYIRNSVKVLINAYDGTVKFYITDKTDPIASAYKKIYPDLFAEEKDVPSDIRSQFIYPEFLYNIQAEIAQRYHDIQPDVLYRGDDVWDIATHNTGKVTTKTGTDIESYYTMVKTVDSQKSELGLVIPYTPYEKQNITSYMVGTYEGGTPKLTIYKFASDSNILGPMQLDTQIEQDEDISSELESLNVTGTKISKNMIIVPLDNTLLYVEPVYQQYINEEDSTPTLKKVVVASGNKVAIGDNLTQALRNLVSQYAVAIEVENTDNAEDLVDAVIKANGNLKQSTSNGDYEMMGKDIQRLQSLIDQLENVVEEDKKEQAEKAKENSENNINNTNEIENTTASENVIANAVM